MLQHNSPLLCLYCHATSWRSSRSSHMYAQNHTGCKTPHRHGFWHIRQPFRIKSTSTPARPRSRKRRRPTGWTAVSTPLINMMRISCFGINLLTAISTSILSFVCYAFVNNTDVAHCSDLHSTAAKIIDEMQDVVDHWEGGLRTTGGALRVDKSFWCLLHFIWRNNQWSYASKTDTPRELYV